MDKPKFFILNKAIRTKKCHGCENSIAPGEYHLEFNWPYKPSSIRKNLCEHCLNNFMCDIINATDYDMEENTDTLQKLTNGNNVYF